MVNDALNILCPLFHYLCLQLDEDEMFNPDYVEVDRVLAESRITDPGTEEVVRHYLVKWRSLPYEESTWELEADVDKEKVEAFQRFNEPPPEDERVERARPHAREWRKVISRDYFVLVGSWWYRDYSMVVHCHPY